VTISDLVQIFQANNVPEHYYTIGGLGGGECYGIEFINGKWTVYYSERGRKTVLEIADSEEVACRQLLSYVNDMMKEDFGHPLDPFKV